MYAYIVAPIHIRVVNSFNTLVLTENVLVLVQGTERALPSPHFSPRCMECFVKLVESVRLTPVPIHMLIHT